jgi:phosphoglucosamine mutase
MTDKKLFGTDGIRGVAGEYPLDAGTVFFAGRALARCLKDGATRVLIGEDTRESSRWIAETFAGGLAAEGIETHSAGVITTPGVAYLARTDGFAAGVMISASHNPYQDNGIKVFAHSGYKLPDELERKVEQNIFAFAEASGSGPVSPVSLRAEESFPHRYLDFLAGLLPPGFHMKGMKVVLDCAHGSASAMAPELFRRLGAKVTVLNADPDGRNINLNCGSLHIEELQKRLPEERADLGVAFDGDADRSLFVTASGAAVNGDAVLLLAARRMKAEGRLKNGLVVATIMSNLGLQTALAREGITMTRTPVGDKYVLEEMLRSGANLGGEQSGHVIFSDDQTTGDGMLTALRVAETMIQSGRSLAELVDGMPVFPQVIRNVPVRQKLPLETLLEVSEAIKRSQEQLGESGRVIVRYSGTETLARIMVEAEDPGAVDRHIESIAAAFARDLGEPVKR